MNGIYTWPDGTAVSINPDVIPEDIVDPRPDLAATMHRRRELRGQNAPTTFDMHRSWWALSRPQRLTLEGIYIGDAVKLRAPTRRVLVRAGLLTERGSITLFGRQVVDEERQNRRIAREVLCKACPTQQLWRHRLPNILCDCACHNDVIRPEDERRA